MNGRVALVTGGTSGIGRAACLEFARAGARVIVSGRDRRRGDEVVRAIRGDGGEAEFIRADLARQGEAEGLVHEAVDLCGRLDYAFNNAAATPGVGRLTVDLEEPEFDEVMMVNTKAVWLLMKHEIRQMLGADTVRRFHCQHGVGERAGRRAGGQRVCRQQGGGDRAH